jgi:hypothetical protein
LQRPNRSALRRNSHTAAAKGPRMTMSRGIAALTGGFRRTSGSRFCTTSGRPRGNGCRSHPTSCLRRATICPSPATGCLGSATGWHECSTRCRPPAAICPGSAVDCRRGRTVWRKCTTICRARSTGGFRGSRTYPGACSRTGETKARTRGRLLWNAFGGVSPCATA